MGKTEDMRAFKEQRRADQRAAAPAVPRPGPTAPPGRAARPAPADDDAPGTTQECGHRSISGTTCTRPAGHPEKSHRYAPAG